MSTPKFTHPPPEVPLTKISFPHPSILLVTLNRPESLNAIPSAQHIALDLLWKWYDDQASLRCAVITGAGRAFCAGADLKEWKVKVLGGSGEGPSGHTLRSEMPESGFGGLSNRVGRKPVISAVNGPCFGGGFEMVLNTDMILATPRSIFGLPEVKRGVVAIAGSLPRLARTMGRQRAAEMALLGRTYKAEELVRWGVVNKVVEGDVVAEAISWAIELANNSPDSILVSREGIEEGMSVGAVEGTRRVRDGVTYAGLERGENIKEGLVSFLEKRDPVWRDSRL